MKSGARFRKVLCVLCAIVGASLVLNIASVVIVYNILNTRTERPDYAVYPGVYTYERADDLDRLEFSFPSGECDLRAYYYASPEERGLVLLVHGRGSGADDLLPLTAALVDEGYCVVSFDCTGVYSSEGEGLVGTCQPLIDLVSLIDYIGRNSALSEMPLYLVGYSLGGYAAASALASRQGIEAVALIAPVNSGPSLMVEKASEYVGGIVYLNKWIFDIYQRILFGDFVVYDGVGGINSSDARVLIAQGLCDETVSHELSSIYAHRHELTNPEISYYLPEGELGTHTGILLSFAAHEYRNETAARLAALEAERGRALTYEEMTAFCSSLDHELYSEVNPELMSMIVDIFEK